MMKRELKHKSLGRGIKQFLILDGNEHILIYRRMDKWYHSIITKYYFSTTPTDRIYALKKRNIRKVYQNTEFYDLITHFTMIAKVTAIEDKRSHQFSICRFLNNSTLNAQWYRITLGVERT